MRNARPRRTRHVSVRFTPEEYAELEDKALTVGVEVSAVIRSLVLSEPLRRRMPENSPDIVALGKALAALNKVGGLLNQIAKEAHITGDLTTYQHAQTDRATLAEVARAIMKALNS